MIFQKYTFTSFACHSLLPFETSPSHIKQEIIDAVQIPLELPSISFKPTTLIDIPALKFKAIKVSGCHQDGTFEKAIVEAEDCQHKVVYWKVLMEQNVDVSFIRFVRHLGFDNRGK